MVEVARPEGVFVDFLQRHDVGLQVGEQKGNLEQRGADAPPRGHSLDRRKPPAMRDIERDDPDAGHAPIIGASRWRGNGKGPKKGLTAGNDPAKFSDLSSRRP